MMHVCTSYLSEVTRQVKEPVAEGSRSRMSALDIASIVCAFLSATSLELPLAQNRNKLLFPPFAFLTMYLPA